MDDIIISMLQLATSLSTSDFLVINVPDQSSETGYATRKVSTNELFLYFLTQVLFSSQLQTSVKTITGAINEIKNEAEDATDAADRAVSGLAELVTAMEALVNTTTYKDGDTVSLTDLIVNGFIEDGLYKVFIPLQKPVATGVDPIITGTWNVRGATTHNITTLNGLGTVETFVEEQGITVVITTQEIEEGIVQFESINAQISFAEEDS